MALGEAVAEGIWPDPVPGKWQSSALVVVLGTVEAGQAKTQVLTAWAKRSGLTALSPLGFFERAGNNARRSVGVTG